MVEASKLRIGQIVQYCSDTIEPCYAAVVTAIHVEGKVNLMVFGPTGNIFPVFYVGSDPSSKTNHFWREVQ